jgi:hypothetical protein
MNAVEIEDAVSGLVEGPFDPAEFPYAFLQAFGNKETTLRKLRSGDTNKSDVGGVLQRNNIHLAVAASGDVSATLAALRETAATAKHKAKFILATDGETVEAEELGSGEPLACAWRELPDHFGFFLPLAGITTVREIRENAFDIRATSKLNKLYLELLKENPAWGTDQRRPDMNHFMARLIFSFFAEDTGIFAESRLFTETISRMSAADSTNTHEVIGTLFLAMNTKHADRERIGLPRWAAPFPFVNGGLFSGTLEVPRFSRTARAYLLQVGSLDWKQINPDIFGSMIQAVADDEERGALGMHYTSVPNILKVLNPLFLDDLRAKLEEAGDNPRTLLNLRKRIARIRVFDPACGSGNFLVIAYKELREIEHRINRKRGEVGRKSEIPLTNFRGIELRDFAAEIARLALIIAEFQCDELYRGQKDAIKDFLPLDAENWITCGNALRLDWLSICPPTGTGVKLVGDDLFSTPLNQSEIDFENEGGETYICGNPPYLGAKKKSNEQRLDMEMVGLENALLLDYVSAFIIKGLDLVQVAQCDMALVSTSSVCQGEQVALLWPRVLDRATISFAYRPFRWSNSAVHNAGVYCTIVGLTNSERAGKKLYSEDAVQICQNISPYLVAGPSVICHARNSPLSELTPMVMGSNPVDGKNLILDECAYRSIIAAAPAAKAFLRRYGGTREIVNGGERWCIWIPDGDVEAALSIPAIRTHVTNCKLYRMSAGRDAQRASVRPHAFCYSTYQDRNGLQVGHVIGDGLAYVPAVPRMAGFVSGHTAYMVYDWKLHDFSLIASSLMRVWTEAVAGRLGNGMRFSNTLVYNTFGVPILTDQNKADLTRCAEEILLAREAHYPATLAELYDPEKMPANLREAHERNDDVLERIYIGRRFRNDTERLEKLFEMYTKMISTDKRPARGRGKRG